MQSLAFILIPGAGGSPWYWHLVTPRLRERGHEALAVELPAADDRAGLPQYADAVVQAIGHRHQAFLDAYEKARSSLKKSSHCLGHELSRCTEDREQFILRIQWDSEEGHLKGFRGSPEFQAFLREVGPFVKDIEEMRHYENTPIRWSRPSPGDAIQISPSLYDWMGGGPAIERLMDRFYDRVVDDPLIGPLFAKMGPDHVAHVAAFVGEVFGGPKTYSERLGGHPEMIRHHVGRSITETQRKRWMTLLLECADEVGIPTDPEFRSAFVAYLEWGTRLAVINSSGDVNVDLAAPMPNWGWGETNGPYLESRDDLEDKHER